VWWGSDLFAAGVSEDEECFFGDGFDLVERVEIMPEISF
jgi:hypothetical protein